MAEQKVFRPLKADDAEEVAALYRCAFGNARHIDPEEVRSWLRNDQLEPEWLHVLEVGGAIVGYGDIEIHDDEVALDVAAPGHWEPFLEWAEEAGRVARKPRLRVYFPPHDELARILRARRYRFWRSSYTMETALADPPPAPVPDGMQ